MSINLVLLSGGIDSLTVLAKLIDRGVQVQAVTIKYPSKHNILERKAAVTIAQCYGIPIHTLDLTSLFESFNSSLLSHDDRPIPEGHYEAESMESTVVPMRNIIFGAAVAGLAVSLANGDISTISLGVHSGDHHIYPDCRPSTMSHFFNCINAASDGTVITKTPFINHDKAYIVRVGTRVGAPYRLTRTCYTSDEVACGKCGSCVERLQAFAANGIDDPIEYQ